MYDELAEWWPLVIDPEGYRLAAAQYARLLGGDGNTKRVLELGSGGGSNAEYLKQHFELTLVDLSPRMLEVSGAANPECEHLEGDMRTVRLEREFDAVFIEDAIDYMTTEDDLRRAIESAFVHCRPGGVCLLVPDDFRETYTPGLQSGGRDLGERSLRYVEWDQPADPSSTVVETDFAFLLRTGSSPTRVVHDHHESGLFPRETWLELCREVGFEPEIQTVEDPEYPREAIVCTRATAT